MDRYGSEAFTSTLVLSFEAANMREPVQERMTHFFNGVAICSVQVQA